MRTDSRRGSRRRSLLLFIAFLFCAILFSLPRVGSARGVAEPASPSQITLVSPPNRSVVQGALAAVVLRLPADRVDELQLFVNNRRVSIPKKNYNKNVVCFDGISLWYGNNELRVVGLKQGKKVGEVRSSVFFRSDISSTASAAPDGYAPYLFHERDSEKGCMPCHQLNLTAITDAEVPAEQSPCFQCHKKLLANYRTVHGPAAVWSCLSCHQKDATPKLSVAKPENKICFNCHEDVWSSMKFGHGPTAMGSCATCHDPHASDYPYFLRAQAGDLCSGCHEEILRKPHVIMGFSNSGHPVRKGVDPYNPTRPFSCVSCHNPHAGTSWTFLQKYDGTSEISIFCRTCHKM